MSQYLGTKFTVLSPGRGRTWSWESSPQGAGNTKLCKNLVPHRVLEAFRQLQKTVHLVLLDAEWNKVEGSKYFGTPYLYKENGFKEREKARADRYLRSKSRL